MNFYMSTLLVFCHFGGNITKEIEEVGDFVYQLNWYELNLDMQKDDDFVGS